MVRQKSGMLSSPTPSLDSLNVSLVMCGDNMDQAKDNTFSLPSLHAGLNGHLAGHAGMTGHVGLGGVNSLGGHESSSSGVSSGTSTNSSIDRTSTGSSGSAGAPPSSPMDGPVFATATPKCRVCSGTYTSPKVLPCFHSFCQSCLEGRQEYPDKVVCPICQTDCHLGPDGVAGLLTDRSVCSDSSPEISGCTGCKSQESTAVANCFDCKNFLCANCVMAHQFMHCFEGHHMTTLGEITSNNSCPQEIKQLDAINTLLIEGKKKATEIRNVKNLEATSTRLSSQYQKALGEVNETYQFYVSMLEERKTEIVKELEQAYSSKQVALSVYSQKAQETADKIFQVTEFVERLMKHASNGEVLMFKKPLEGRLHQLLAYTPDINLAAITELEFISNFQAIQVGVRNQFGYVKTKQEVDGPRQPPISRPVGVPPTSASQAGVSSLATLRPATSSSMSSIVRDLLDQSYISQLDMSGYSATPPPSHFSLLPPTPGVDLDDKWPPVPTPAKSRDVFSTVTTSVPASSRNSTPSANDSISLSRPSHHIDPILELSSNLFSQSSLTTPPLQSSAIGPFPVSPIVPMYPPKSQIKRQKMIYHCKFGEFGILEGQFTEPSGVTVNAQNDIIVADTNNHRIQIFDKEGRFKYQFGEVGKRDGQLLYPNRVAVVRNTGDIVVTERSPTHQVQIYNQFGQFIRKFGANILQHPRGVCVDNRGRVIAVECKVMRVLIFDQNGNLLNKFGCSKHLEFPNGVVVNDKQEIFISDNRAHCVKVFDYNGNYLRQIGGEGITNYPIGVGINAAGEITIADNHNNFNLTVFTQDGQLVSALESKVKHAQCFDVALMDDGSVVLASKDYRLYIYRYIQVPPIGL